jgi:hypothetical protein
VFFASVVIAYASFPSVITEIAVRPTVYRQLDSGL